MTLEKNNNIEINDYAIKNLSKRIFQSFIISSAIKLNNESLTKPIVPLFIVLP